MAHLRLRPGRRACPAWILLAALPLGAAELPPAPGDEAGDASVCSRRCAGVKAIQVAEPSLGRGQATALGLALGFGLGLALGEGGSGAPLEGWRPADAVVLASAAVVDLAPRTLWRHEAPDLLGGRWTDCATDAGTRHDGLGGFDRAARSWLAGTASREKAALRRRAHLDRISYTTLGAALALPLGAAGTHPERDLLVTVEALGLAGAATEAAKHLFHRPRPFVHYCDPMAPADLCGHDAQQSFFSGHAALAMAGAVAAGRMAGLRGGRNEGAIWASGLALATSTAALRVAADKHYATDVLVGLLVGGAAGWWVPTLHRPPVTPASAARGPTPPAATAVRLPVRLPGLGPSSVGVGLGGGGTSLWVIHRW